MHLHQCQNTLAWRGLTRLAVHMSLISYLSGNWGIVRSTDHWTIRKIWLGILKLVPQVTDTVSATACQWGDMGSAMSEAAVRGDTEGWRREQSRWLWLFLCTRLVRMLARVSRVTQSCCAARKLRIPSASSFFVQDDQTHCTLLVVTEKEASVLVAVCPVWRLLS